MHQPTVSVHSRAIDSWLARGAAAAVVALQLTLINNFLPGPRWLLPALEIALLLPILVATGWILREERDADTDEQRHAALRNRHLLRMLALALTLLLTLVNFFALSELVRALLVGKSESGTTLLLDALNIWFSNVIIFALWFWGLDRGGPTVGKSASATSSEFLFPQMTFNDAGRERPFTPGFVDYLFLSFTNATAFSPTDTAPLSQRMKLLMMFEASISLLTIALVAARAVNILA